MRTLAGCLIVVLMIVALSTATPSSQGGGSSRSVTQEEYERWKKDLSNWGRWGKDDEIGALNLITPAKRRQAAALVKEGVSVSLAGDADTVKAVDNQNPYEHTMLGIGSDRIGVSYHGMKQGHTRNSIHNVKNGIFTRGILIDIPRLKGVPYLEPGTPIYVEDLEAWEKKAGVKVSAGDALFVRTGVGERLELEVDRIGVEILPDDHVAVTGSVICT